MSQTHDWSLMPTDILATIFEYLNDSDVDRRRISGVCTSWRFAVSLLPTTTTLEFTLELPHFHVRHYRFSCMLKKNTLYLLSSPQSPSRVWLIRVARPRPNRWILYNPLFPGNSPRPPQIRGPERYRILNLLRDYRILRAAKSYAVVFSLIRTVVDNTFDRSGLPPGIPWIVPADQPRKIVVTPTLKYIFFLFKSGKLGLGCEKEWINFETECRGFKDIVFYDDEFYAIDENGVVVKIALKHGSSTQAQLIPVTTNTTPLLQVDHPCLVTSNGNLYLVLIKKNEEEFENPCSTFVFKQHSRAWEQVQSLGDRVLFLLNHVNFSFSATDLGWTKGNLIYFLDREVPKRGLTGDGMKLLKVYDMENSRISTPEELPQPVFWPPPNWATLTLY